MVLYSSIVIHKTVNILILYLRYLLIWSLLIPSWWRSVCWPWPPGWVTGDRWPRAGRGRSPFASSHTPPGPGSYTQQHVFDDAADLMTTYSTMKILASFFCGRLSKLKDDICESSEYCEWIAIFKIAQPLASRRTPFLMREWRQRHSAWFLKTKRPKLSHRHSKN